MEFEKLTYQNGLPVKEVVEFESHEAAYNFLDEIWRKDKEDIVGLLTTDYKNGNKSYELYAKHGRLVVRLKPVKHIPGEQLNLLNGTE